MEDKASDEMLVKSSPGPPPESTTVNWTRRSVLCAFWMVVVCLGLPHWTWTTSIHRSELPLDTMNAWADGRACQLHYPVHIALRANDLSDEESVRLSHEVQTLLNAEPTFPLHTFHVVPDSSSVPITEHLNSTGRVLTIIANRNHAGGTPKTALRSWLPVLDVHHIIPKDSGIAQLAQVLAGEVLKVFQDESASLNYLLQDTPFGASVHTHDPNPHQRSSLDGRTTRAFKPASSYHLTFSLFTPLATPAAWEIDQALEQYIIPLLTPLSSVSNFTIDTQVQLYATFSPSIAGPVFENATQSWRLHYGDLTGFVNAAEWPLSPSIGSGPTINLVLYVPSSDKSPLLIDANGGTSWVVPQWGGVQIHNPTTDSTATLTLDELRPDMLVFADQLASLIGLPPSPPSLALRISSLSRERATSLIMSASSTLGALARLTLKLTSISIPDTVAKSVDETIHRLDQACSDLRAGNFDRALENARIAEAEVEQAFFEPSMIGQVYFPEEHKVAVYVPLLGPMAVPLIMAALKELKSLRGRKVKAA